MRFTLSLAAALAAFGVARADYGRLVVVTPPDATVVANNYTLTQTADGVRRVESQDLQRGKSYYYTLVATVNRNGVPLTERRVVSVEAGFETRVDFHFPAQAAFQPQGGFQPGFQPQGGFFPPNAAAGLQGGGMPGGFRTPGPGLQGGGVPGGFRTPGPGVQGGGTPGGFRTIGPGGQQPQPPRPR